MDDLTSEIAHRLGANLCEKCFVPEDRTEYRTEMRGAMEVTRMIRSTRYI